MLQSCTYPFFSGSGKCVLAGVHQGIRCYPDDDILRRGAKESSPHESTLHAVEDFCLHKYICDEIRSFRMVQRDVSLGKPVLFSKALSSIELVAIM